MKLNFSYNNADYIPIGEICNQLWLYKYSGIELLFQREQFDPENISLNRIIELENFFKNSPIKAVCISTATT